MSVAVRLRKIGKGTKKTFYYRIGVIDRRKSRDARVIEDIGMYDPSKKNINFQIDLERYSYWKSKGADISPTITSLVKKGTK